MLKELRAQASLEDFEKIVESVEEQQALEDQEIAMFGRILGKDELLEELEELAGGVAGGDAIPDAPIDKIDVVPQIPDAPKTKIEVAAQEEEEEDEFAERMKKLEAA